MQTTAPDTDKTETADVPGARALLRGLDVLMAIGAAATPLKFGELQELVDVPKGSLHRLLSALISRGLVRMEAQGRRYSVGPKVFDLARRALDQNSIIRAARPELARLSRQFKQACCLYVMDGDVVFVIDFDDPDASNSRVVRAWPNLHARRSAAGLAILSAADIKNDEDETNLVQAKALGYSIFDGQHPSVGAPILDAAGHPVASIACHFETSRYSAGELHELGRTIKESAIRASANVGMTVPATAIAERPTATDIRVKVHNTGRDFMGENPVWDAQLNRLWWLDVLAPALRYFDFTSQEVRRIMLPDLTGGMALSKSGSLLLAGRKGLHLFDPVSHALTLLVDPEQHRANNRFNSASVDQNGNLWVGSMPIDGVNGSGSLYEIGSNFSVHVVMPEIDMPKNVAWAPDRSEMYISEGRSGRLYAFQTDQVGRIANKRTLFQGSPEIGNPNGIAVDTEGNIWVAMIGGWSVCKIDPTGALLDVVDLPIPMPTALAFAGPSLDKLFVTSTYLRMPGGYSSIAPQAGNLIEIASGARGLPTFEFGA